MFYRFPVRVEGGFEVYRCLFQAVGVHVRRGVDTLLHRRLGLDECNFPVAERLFAETVSIPIYPALTREGQSRVISCCREIFAEQFGQERGRCPTRPRNADRM